MRNDLSGRNFPWERIFIELLEFTAYHLTKPFRERAVFNSSEVGGVQVPHRKLEILTAVRKAWLFDASEYSSCQTKQRRCEQPYEAGIS